MVNEYKLYTIENRVQNIPMPIIRLIDMRGTTEGKLLHPK